MGSMRGSAPGSVAGKAGGAWLALRAAGAGLLFATGGIHLDLYLTGYRTIPAIGWLFLLQAIASLGLGALVLAMPGSIRVGGLALSGLACAAGALLAIGTLAGYLVTLQFGMFGFKEIRTTAGLAAGVVEVAAFAVLSACALEAARRHWRFSAGPSVAARGPALSVGALSVAGLALLGIGLAAASPAGAGSGLASGPGVTASGGPGLRSAVIRGTRVLTNAAGRTLYWFGRDTSTRSACTGSCAVYWPPVAGPLRAASSVPGRLGTISRPGGGLQETYDGHPLYTYAGDSGPGQAHGNNLNLNGGVWHEVVVAQ